MKRLKKNLRAIFSIIIFNVLMWALTIILNYSVNIKFISKNGFYKFINATMLDKDFIGLEFFFKCLSLTTLAIGIIIIFGIIISLILKKND
jgi:hypothetical protein